MGTVPARLGTDVRVDKVRARLGTARVRLGTVRARQGTVRKRLGTVCAKLGKVHARHMIFWISKKKFQFFLLQKFQIFLYCKVPEIISILFLED